MQIRKVKRLTPPDASTQHTAVTVYLRNGEVTEEDFALTLANAVKRAIEGVQ